jgi:hypothetical protein
VLEWRGNAAEPRSHILVIRQATTLAAFLSIARLCWNERWRRAHVRGAQDGRWLDGALLSLKDPISSPLPDVYTPNCSALPYPTLVLQYCVNCVAPMVGCGAAAVASPLAAVLTEIYLCGVCSCQKD